MYRTLRTIHLLAGAFALPMLLMYATSAVQMAHPGWFRLKPAVSESRFTLPAGSNDGRRLAYNLMAARNISGELQQLRSTAQGYEFRIVRPGTVHEIRYDHLTGATHLQTLASPFIGVLNRLHHAAGMAHHDYLPLTMWGVLVALASMATVTLAGTGVWMWWLRRQQRRSGLILVGANLAFTLAVFLILRLG
ncbi:MAG: PepSY-associated TM helix domain-containing protein [Bryobacterales bacterium]|nr:PepSY-associated TM helix domain-containing protein [Bryobacterales bacterium]